MEMNTKKKIWNARVRLIDKKGEDIGAFVSVIFETDSNMNKHRIENQAINMVIDKHGADGGYVSDIQEIESFPWVSDMDWDY